MIVYTYIYIYSHYYILYAYMLHASYAQNGHGSSFLRLFVGRCSAGSWGTTICLKSRGKQGETPFVFRCIPAPVPPWTWAIYKAEKADDVLSQSCPENKCFKSVLGRPIFTYPYLVHSSTMFIHFCDTQRCVPNQRGGQHVPKSRYFESTMSMNVDG